MIGARQESLESEGQREAAEQGRWTAWRRRQGDGSQDGVVEGLSEEILEDVHDQFAWLESREVECLD